MATKSLEFNREKNRLNWTDKQVRVRRQQCLEYRC